MDKKWLSNKEKLIKEYEIIPKDLTLKNYFTANIFKSKNIFDNILSSEETRVKITGDSYINANYIFDNYIATQQPVKNTLTEFWQMVDETNSKMIINLSGDNDYLINNPNVEDIFENDIYHLRIISLKNKIYHLTFKTWKDFGVPDFFEFDKFFTIVNLLECTPIIVHCKAGVGRTGTFIFIHYILKNINKGIYLDLIEVVKDMRRYRCNMIQTKGQFNYAVNFISNKIQ